MQSVPAPWTRVHSPYRGSEAPWGLYPMPAIRRSGDQGQVLWRFSAHLTTPFPITVCTLVVFIVGIQTFTAQNIRKGI